MKRAFLAIAIGLLATISLAWLAVARSAAKTKGPARTVEWPPGAPEGWPKPDFSFVSEGLGLRVRSYTGVGVIGTVVQFGAVQVSAGWPWPALEATRFERFPNTPTEPPLAPIASRWDEGVLDVTKYRRLPIKPLFPGLLLDTLVHGCVAWGVLAGVLLVRQRVRRRKGLCPGCAYPLQSATCPCPECGMVAAPASK